VSYTFQRYTAIELPAYRFVPGQDLPHPIRDPRGHSYHRPGTPEVVPAYKRARQWRDCAAYLYGCDLYNHGYWWEAHEAWEGLWKQCRRDGAQRYFLQALIQTTVCHLKLEMGNMNGVRSLRRTSNRHFRCALRRMVSDEFMGLKLRAWYEGVFAYYEHVLTAGGNRHGPGRYPYIALNAESRARGLG